MLSEGEDIYYIEYLDHARINAENVEKFKKNPVILWCVGKITDESEDFLLVVCSGVRNMKPNKSPTYEMILKKAIIQQELIFTV